MSRIETTNRPAPVTQNDEPIRASPGTAAEDPPAMLPDASLHEMTLSGDTGAMIAALLLESGKASREVARKARDAAAAAEDAAHADKIEHMESAATSRMIGGIAGGGCQAAGGTAAVFGSVARNDPWLQSKPIFEGGGTIGKSLGDFAATNADIEKEHADRALTQAKRGVESAGETDKDAKELLRRALGYYGEYVRAKDDATRAALFRA